MRGPHAVNTTSISYHETRRDEDESKRSDTIIKLHYERASARPSLSRSLSRASGSNSFTSLLEFVLVFSQKERQNRLMY